jgi:hypothetical protein
MLIRRAALALGLMLVGLVAFFAVPGNGVFETGRHQLAGTILSHLAMLTLLSGAAPTLRRAVARLDTVPPDRLGLMLAAGVVGPIIAVSGLRFAAPRATHQLLTREWGVVEPLQVALYLTAAWLCLAIRNGLAVGDRARTLYRAGAIAALVFALEETDYLGVLNLLVRAAGAPEGRFGRKHIGGFHDMLDAAAQQVSFPVVPLAELAGLLALWMLFGRFHDALRREALRPSSVPLGIFVVALLAAQVVDIDDQFIPPSLAIRILEETLELVAVLALDAALILRLSSLSRGRPG